MDPGADPDTFPVSNATAVGYRANVSQSNSLVLGSVAGQNGATDDVKVGIGTTAPEEALHVARSDGSARILVEETNSTAAIRQIYEMKNVGGVGFQMTDTRPGEEAWQFQTNLGGNFSINNVGDPSGGTEFFLFQDSGDMLVEGVIEALGFDVSSDRNLKENFTEVDPQEVLKKVAQLPVTEWNFKAHDDTNRHMGPMAQDFHTAFGLGNDETRISSVDAAGVALAAIQGLNEKLVEKDQQLVEQQLEIQKLKAELAEIREMLGN